MDKAKDKYKNKVCWSCGGTDLMPDTRGVRCRSCGATYNDVSSLGHASVILAPRGYSPGDRWRPYGAAD